MKILWDAGTPMVASDIVKAGSSLNINTVQASLRVLLKAGLVEVADIVYSGTVLSRSYRPLISRDAYFDAEYKDIVGNSSTSSLIAAFIRQEQDTSELERIEQMIEKRKKSRNHNNVYIIRTFYYMFFCNYVPYYISLYSPLSCRKYISEEYQRVVFWYSSDLYTPFCPG